MKIEWSAVDPQGVCPLSYGMHWVGVRIVLALFVVTLIAGCSTEVRQTRRLERAAVYFEEGAYDACIIESMNVLKSDPMHPAALRFMALANSRLGNLRQAFPFLVSAAEIRPDDVEVRLALGALYRMAGQPAEARAEADAVLALLPTNIQAIQLLVDTTASDEIAGTLDRLAGKAGALDGNPFFHTAIGNLHLRSGNLAAAGEAFRKARAVDPDSHAASLAMAAWQVAQGDLDAAAREYATAARQAPDDPMVRVQWADLEIRRGALDVAQTILDAADTDSPHGATVLFHRARIAMAHREVDRALELLGQALARNPRYPDALFIQANANVLKGDIDIAIGTYEELLRRNPQAGLVRKQLGLAHLANQDLRKGMLELERALSAMPEDADLAQLLGELQLRTGDAAKAIGLAESVVRSHPERTGAHLLLATAYLSVSRLEDAERACRATLALTPADARAHYLLGEILLARRDTDGAYTAFAAALDVAPRFTPALAQLVTMDIHSRRSEAAIERLDGHLERFPDDANAVMLLGRAHQSLGHVDQAEALFLKSIDLQPRLVGAYTALGELYGSADRIDSAIEKIEDALAMRPGHAPTLMLAGLLYQQQGNRSQAIAVYERLLARQPDFIAAQNTLAYLLAQDPASLERAYTLARGAHEAAPEDVYVADTFGWILYQRGAYRWALTVLQKGAQALADVPEARYHLGMAYYAVGQEDQAAAALRGAVGDEAKYPGVETARRTLAAMNLPLDSSSPNEALARIEDILSGEPDNLAANFKRAGILAVLERTAEALAAYERTLNLSPVFTPAWIAIAEIHADQTGDFGRARAAASEAYKLAPEDPAVAGLLGRMAYLTGERAWALALLRESAVRMPDHPRVLFTLALAHYSQGDLDAAERQAQRALASEAVFPERDEAQRFVDLLGLYQRRDRLDEVPAEVDALLESDPGYAPAAMVAAAVFQRTGRREEAVARYESVLDQYPEFAVVRARLAELYAADESTRGKAYDLAVQARTALPHDPVLARTLGILAAQRGDHRYALPLIRQALEGRAPDAEAHYYIGLCHQKLNEREPAVRALKRALELAPDAAFAPQAREWIADPEDLP